METSNKIPIPRARSLPRPTIQPRTKGEHSNSSSKSPIDGMVYKKRLQKSKSLPQAETYTPKLTPRVAKKMDDSRKQVDASRKESETLSLSDLVVWNSHLLPARVQVVTGHIAENDNQPNIYVGDVFTVHGIKKSKVVMIMDSRSHVYNVPLYSSAKFGIVGDSVQSDEYVCTYTFRDLLTAKPQPRVIASLSSYQGYNDTMSVKQYEVFIVNDVFNVSENSQMGAVIGAFSVTTAKQKFIPKECNVLFTTDPAATQLYLSEIIEHAPHLLPCRARLFASEEQTKLPKYLTTDLVTIEDLQSETSFITSLHQWEGDVGSSSQTEIYMDIHTSINIEVRVESTTVDNPSARIHAFNFTKFQACLDTAEDDTTNSQALRVLRKGYEQAGTNIHVPGVKENDEVFQSLISMKDSDVYDDVSVYAVPSKKKSSVHLGVRTSEEDSDNECYDDVVLGEDRSPVHSDTKRFLRPVHYTKSTDTTEQQAQRMIQPTLIQSAKNNKQRKVTFNPIIKMLDSTFATDLERKVEPKIKDKSKPMINSKPPSIPSRKKQPVPIPKNEKSSRHSWANRYTEAPSHSQEQSLPPCTGTRFDVQDVSESIVQSSHQRALDSAILNVRLQRDQLRIVPLSLKEERAKSMIQNNSKQTTKESSKQTTKESGMQTTKESDKQAAKESGKQATKESDKQAAKESGKQAAKESDKQAAKESSKQTTKESDKQAAKESDKQATKEKVLRTRVSTAMETTIKTQLSQTAMITSDRSTLGRDHTAVQTSPNQTRSDVATRRTELSLQTVNKTLLTVLDKLDKIEQRQTQFEERLTNLEKGKQKAIPKEVSTMTRLEIQNLLDAMDMTQYKDAFSREWVDGEVFKELDEESLKNDLGVTSRVHRIKLMKVISTGQV